MTKPLVDKTLWGLLIWVVLPCNLQWRSRAMVKLMIYRNSIVPRSLTSILDSEVIRSHNTRIVFSSRHFLGTEPMRHWLDIKDLYYLLKFNQSFPINHGISQDCHLIRDVMTHVYPLEWKNKQ